MCRTDKWRVCPTTKWQLSKPLNSRSWPLVSYFYSTASLDFDCETHELSHCCMLWSGGGECIRHLPCSHSFLHEPFHEVEEAFPWRFLIMCEDIHTCIIFPRLPGGLSQSQPKMIITGVSNVNHSIDTNRWRRSKRGSQGSASNSESQTARTFI